MNPNKDQANRRYLFDLSFDEEQLNLKAEAEQESEAEGEPSYSQAELEAAREDGIAHGRSLAAEEANQGHEAKIADVMAEIDSALPIIQRQQEAANAALEASVMQAFATVCRKLMPSVIESAAEAEIRALLVDCLAKLVSDAEITIQVSECFTEALETRFQAEAAQAGFADVLTVVANPSLEPGDCRIAWADGGAERDLTGLWQSVDRILEALVQDTEEAGANPAGLADAEETSDGSEPTETTDEASLEVAPDTDLVAADEPETETPVVSSTDAEGFGDVRTANG